MFLLDVNLLIVLLDEWHPRHAAALAFLPRAHADGWATCPLTENGFLRILGHPNYWQGRGTAEGARALLTALCAAPGHQFWPDAVTLRETRRVTTLPASGQLTDASPSCSPQNGAAGWPLSTGASILRGSWAGPRHC